MFPCHTDHYNADCDKSDNNLPAMPCYSGRSGLWKNRISPFVLVDVRCFVCVRNKIFNLFHLSHRQCFFFFFCISFLSESDELCHTVISLTAALSINWDVGQRAVQVKHGVTAGALNIYTAILRKTIS